MQAALAAVHRTGLTVTLEHISFEDVIRDAGVSRSSAYRRWPYKDLFLSDLVKELAKDASATMIKEEVELIRRAIADHEDWLATAELRHGLVIELVRRLALFDYEAVLHSSEWRTYIALHAAFMSLADGELRNQIQQALALSEEARNSQIASVWQVLAGLFGYRLRSELGTTTFEALARLLTSTLRGLVILSLSRPDLADHRSQAKPFGATTSDDWSLAAIGFASIASAFLEPDPSIEWNQQRLASIQDVLNKLLPPNI